MMKERHNGKIKSYIQQLPKKKLVQLIVAALLTIGIIVLIPVTYGWFTQERKMGVLSNINAPYTLYLSSGNQESVVYFEMSAIDVGVPNNRVITHKDYVFSVQGSWDIKEYYLQLAHTTNIPFKYSIYRVNLSDIRSEAQYSSLSDELKATTVAYIAHTDNGDISKGQTIYYTYIPSATYTYANAAMQYGKVMDEANYVNKVDGEQLAVKNSANTYYKQTYDPTDTGKVQKNAVPLYMQAGPIKKEASTPNGQDFCDYYVLRVDWADAPLLKNDKETDEIYITVVSPSMVRSGD